MKKLKWQSRRGMRSQEFISLIFVILLWASCSDGSPKKETADAASSSTKELWPEVTRESRPWTRWWWMGNAVDPENISSLMTTYAGVGFGGVEITPIYGVHGYENRFIRFLSPEWVENLKFTLQEGKRLDMGVDLAMASGWPFGGLWVTPGDACKYMSIKSYDLKEGEQLAEKVAMVQEPMLRSISRRNLDINKLEYPVSANADSLQNWAIDQVRYPKPMPLQTLMAYSDKGITADLTAHVSSDGTLNWTAPAGNWTLYAVFEGWHGKMVERAGPGGEGDVIDHFSALAIDNYLAHFDSTFNGHDLSGLRAWFNDSYEVDDARGEADFTPLMFSEFKKRRGYDLRKYLPALSGQDTEENNQRVLCDYRETISDLILENYTQRWHNWAVKGGKVIRNQAHGAPANILDLYAAADIPETEGQDIVKAKTASSVAHVTGKKLASSESATWLGDHFEASLKDVKYAIDLLLLAGINHVFYHGTTYSPKDAPWPGWMFYAAVHFAPSNTFWKDIGTLNTYIARSQSFLQAGQPDNDILLYYPVSDEYAIRGRSLLRHFDGAAKGTAVRLSAEYLLSKGYAFDYISDRQILTLTSKSGRILTGGTSYQTVLLPSLKLIPLETFEKIITLAKNGATILIEQMPEDVPGLGNLEKRSARFQKFKKELKFTAAPGVIQMAVVGKGRILTGTLPDMLSQANIRRETMFDQGLQCIRRTDGSMATYFIANRGTGAIDGMVPLTINTSGAVLFDPMTGAYGRTMTRTSGETGDVYLQLVPGESCLVKVFTGETGIPEYPFRKASGESGTLGGTWTLTFVSGGPGLPQPVEMPEPAPWTGLDGDSYKAFSGTAVYRTTFAKPSEETVFYRLDIGKVAHSARISLNGKESATLICAPYTVDIPASELKEENNLEIAVTNLMGNRIADMERKGQPYKIFYNVNFPAYKAENRGADGLFTTLGWQPRESGLTGPVTLTPLQPVQFK